MNEQNLLVEKSADGDCNVIGILDFQDAGYGCKVYDIAICIMYMMTISDNPMDTGGYCLQGFLGKQQLSQSELDVLYYGVVGRFVTSLVLGLYSYETTKDPYTLVTQRSWGVLEHLWELPHEQVLKYWLSDKFSNV